MSKHIVIVGAGVIGLSVAYYSAQRGHRVTIIEREGPDHGGCSFGNAGMIVPSHFVPLASPGAVALGLKWMWNPESPFYVKPRLNWDLIRWGVGFWKASNPEHVARSSPVLRDLSYASRTCFEELAGLRQNDFGLVKRGLLMLCKSHVHLLEEAKYALQAQKLGVPAEVLDAQQTARLDPSITMDIAGSVYFPRDCHLTPGQFMAGLKEELDRLQVDLKWNTPVRGWRTENGKVAALRLDGTEVMGDEYVLCGGSWSPEVANGLKLNLPMQAGKGYSLTLAKPRQLPEICSILCEARVAVTPMGSSLRIGGTMEIAGLNEEINPVRVRGIVKAVPKYFPEFKPDDFAGIKPWCGLRPCSPDGLPYIGRASRFSNLSVATGHAMMGLSLGPITGKLMAEILSGDKPSIDIQLLDPNRYN